MSSPFVNGKIIRRDCPNEVYRCQPGTRGKRDFVMSRSDLLDFAACPAKWIQGHRSDHPSEWGSLMDVLVLQPRRFQDVYVLRPESYPADVKGETVSKPWNGNATWCKEWLHTHRDREVISLEVVNEAELAVEALNRDSVVACVLSHSDHQVFAQADYQDPDTGMVVTVKILVDIAPESGNTLADLKTARDASERAWTRAVYEHGYHVQGALYLDVWNAATGEARDLFSHVIQENTPPYHVERRYLDPEFVAIGRDTYQRALAQYCQCLKSGEWPGYPTTREVVNGWTRTTPEVWMLSSSMEGAFRPNGEALMQD